MAHHALCAVLEPLFERAAIFDSYACRLGKGSHRAVRRAQQFSRRFGRFLKLDIRKFFETSDHEVLKAGLRRLVKDGRLLELADRIIAHGATGSPTGKGLPNVRTYSMSSCLTPRITSFSGIARVRTKPLFSSTRVEAVLPDVTVARSRATEIQV